MTFSATISTQLSRECWKPRCKIASAKLNAGCASLLGRQVGQPLYVVAKSYVSIAVSEVLAAPSVKQPKFNTAPSVAKSTNEFTGGWKQVSAGFRV
jgi:hypothetical protein